MSPKFAKGICCIILAAGKGKRFKTQIPKVLHPVFGRPMICYCLDIVKQLGIKKTYIVCGHKDKELKDALGSRYSLEFIKQKKLLGSGDAVKAAKRKFLNRQADILILYADTPLLKPQTIRRLILEHKNDGFACTILTARLSYPCGYGRINRNNASGEIESIIEDTDASWEQKKKIRS